MDPCTVNPRKSYHIRSNSLPSKPHPIVAQVEEHLCRLKASEATSSTSLCHILGGLQDLHDCIDNLLLLPLTQQALVQDSDRKWIDDLLEGSIRLLDLCDIAKDGLLQTKECAREVELVFRRRGGEMVIASAVQKYFNSQKMMKKTIHKALKGIESRNFQKSDESSAIACLLKEVEAVTYSIVKSLLSFIAGPKLPSRWSLVSKLVSKKVACKDEETNANEVQLVDAALYSIASQRTNKSDFLMQVENVQDSLRKVEFSIRDLEEDLESLYRRLIKNRVSFLNILNH